MIRASAGLRILTPFGVPRPILYDFGDPSKSEGAPKTVQKIQYGDFLAPLGGQKVKKRGLGRRLEKNMKIRRPFVRFRSPLGKVYLPPHPPSALGPSFSAPLLLTNPSEGYASF